MSINSALQIASGGLANINRQMAVISQNISNVNTPDYAREVDRYIAVPGQATSFMIGMRTVLDEREHVGKQP